MCDVRMGVLLGSEGSSEGATDRTCRKSSRHIASAWLMDCSIELGFGDCEGVWICGWGSVAVDSEEGVDAWLVVGEIR